MKKILILLFFIGLAGAESVPHIFMLHINGINTTFVQARTNTSALKRVISPTVTSNILTYDLVWNPTAGDGSEQTILDNILDVMKQKATEQSTLTLDEYTEIWMKAFPHESYVKGSESYEKLKSQIKQKYVVMV